MKLPQIFNSHSNNVFHNLSFGEFLVKNASAPILFLCRNNKHIQIGKHQNPWKSLRLDLMRDDGVELYRRSTGGHALYQDLGHSAFSFLIPGAPGSRASPSNNAILIRALTVLGIEANVSRRNSILVGAQKVSESIYRTVQGVSQHQGTMSLNVNKEDLFKYMREDVTGEGTLNLTELNAKVTHELFSETMKKSFKKDYPDAEELELYEFPSEVNELAQAADNWNWKYGENPQFSHQFERRFEWGLVELRVQVDDGVVTCAKVFSDCWRTEFIALVEDSLVSGDAIKRIKESCRGTECEMIAEELNEWLQCELNKLEKAKSSL